MKNADLYVRVSTDEQAQKGYSLQAQEAVLRQYCRLRDIRVRDVICEDHSAKTFNRPEWKKLLVNLKKRRQQTDLLLFTKWDRFSRNTSDAYQMISLLRKLGVEPQAIEQPLDTSIPENKMMLAIYLTTPEIENDRRGLNTFFGIRQAKKEGRWMGKAPLGYRNRIMETGRRYIAIHQPEADTVKWIFKQLGEGIFSAEQILNTAREERKFICSKNNFYTCIRNPMYCGKIRIPGFNDEPEQFVKGLHEPLISEELFYRVQEILDKRKRVYGFPIATPKELTLRNFIKCNKCERMLTGSASKGRKTYHVYYHCRSACGIRYNARKVNEAFEDELASLIPKPGYSELFVQAITDCYEYDHKSVASELKTLKKLIDDHNKLIDRARDLMLEDEIEASEYRRTKEEENEKILRLEIKLKTTMEQKSILIDIRPIAELAVKALESLDRLYDVSTVEGKRYIVGTLFPEKLTFDGSRCRTTKMNEAAELIYLKNKELRAKKMGQKSSEMTLSHKG